MDIQERKKAKVTFLVGSDTQVHPNFSELNEGHPEFSKLDGRDFSVVDVRKDVEKSLECKIKIFKSLKKTKQNKQTISFIFLLLIANQIVGFFNQPCLQNNLTDLSDLLFGLIFKGGSNLDWFFGGCSQTFLSTS